MPRSPRKIAGVPAEFSREVRPAIRPPSVVNRAQKAWDIAMKDVLEKGGSYVDAAKSARDAYDKVIQDYDRVHKR